MHKTRHIARATLAIGLTALVIAFLSSADRSAATGNTIAHPEPPELDGGMYSSVAMDSQDRPIVSHYASDTQDLKVLHCGDPACENGNTDVAPDVSAADVGQYSSLVLDDSGNPIVSYYDNTNGHLKLLRCGNPACTAGNSVTTADFSASVGQYTSAAITTDGDLVISYYDAHNGDLRVRVCADLVCGKAEAASPDTEGNVGLYTSLTLDAEDRPVVSYYDLTHGDLKVLHCGDRTCTAGNTIASPVTIGNVGQYSSIKLNASGRPMVAYYDVDAGHLWLLVCSNANCTGGNDGSELDVTNTAGEFVSMQLDEAFHPVVAYHDIGNHTLRVLHCTNPACTGTIIRAVPDATGNASNDVGWYSSLALDGDGNPVVSYRYRMAVSFESSTAATPTASARRSSTMGTSTATGRSPLWTPRCSCSTPPA